MRPALRARSLRVLHRRGTYACLHTSSAWRALQRFKLADIGEGITECEVVKWNVKPNAVVQAFDQLCEVQSDKASVEITSPFDGTVTQLLVPEGQIAKVGEALCVIETTDEAAENVDTALAEPAQATPPPHPAQEEAAASVSSASSSTPEPPKDKFPRRWHPLDPNAPPPSPQDASRGPRLGLASDRDALATPAVRHFARRAGVNIALLAPGSGKGGRIEMKDVQAFLSHESSSTGAAASSADTTSVNTPEATDVKQDVVVELGRTRYGMWKAMEKSLQIPHFGYSIDLDLTHLHNILPLLNAHIPPHFLPPSTSSSSSSSRKVDLVSPSAVHPAPSPPSVPEGGHFTRLTYLPFLLKTLARAMHGWPLFRSSITPSAAAEASAKPTLTVRPNADIALALSTPTGLYTPTLASVNTLSAYTIASRLGVLAHRGRQTPSLLTPADMPKRGGTITVSNVGAIGRGTGAMPVLVPGGGVAIVAIGRARWVWDVETKEAGERRLKVNVSWAADHRVVEGAELAAFVEEWRSWVEHPEKLIADSI